jgi:hypothetical protein
MSRAKKESKDWAICEALRSDEAIQYEVLEVVRGRKAAHSRERQLIEEAESISQYFLGLNLRGGGKP